jgi:hypothetical protein
MKHKKSFIFFASALIWAIPARVGALKFPDPIGATDPIEVFARVIQGLLAVVAVWSLLNFTIAGIGIILSRGNSEKLEKHKENLKWTVVGIAFVFQPQDLCVTEGAGPIADRTHEHLGATDIAISIARKLMFQAIGDVAEGKRPAHVVESPEANRFPVVFARTDTVPDGQDWKDFYERIDAELGAGSRALAGQA